MLISVAEAPRRFTHTFRLDEAASGASGPSRRLPSGVFPCVACNRARKKETPEFVAGDCRQSPAALSPDMAVAIGRRSRPISLFPRYWMV